MHTYSTAYIHLSKLLQELYEEREAAAIAHEMMEHITDATKLQRITDKNKQFTSEQEAEYNRVLPLLQIGTPIQYVLGYGWFMGNKYIVNEHVLIPRPETEELVDWIATDWKNKQPDVLDIGTGSGCIPISLKLSLPESIVTSLDVSEGAIATAKQNATSLNADVQFMLLDFLNESLRSELPQYDVIVSNPPYIPEAERDTLHENVRDHEPGTALFVPDDDALLFYRKIAAFGKTHLKDDGAIYCELHVDYGIQTEELFKQSGYTYTELRKDMHGNMRMLKAQK